MSQGVYALPATIRSLPINQAAEALGVSRRCIYNYLRDGRLTAIQAGYSKRVTVESLLKADTALRIRVVAVA